MLNCNALAVKKKPLADFNNYGPLEREKRLRKELAKKWNGKDEKKR